MRRKLMDPDAYKIVAGDCLDVMRDWKDESVNLIVTSPPYAEARKETYGAIPHDEYVEWFLPRAWQMMRILKPDGSLILNIKENVVHGERHTYVLELILAMRRQGWWWTDEFIWHKVNSMPRKWPYRFRDGWERLLHFSKRKNIKMNQDAVMIPASEATLERAARVTDQEYVYKTSNTGSRFQKRHSNMIGRNMVYPSNVLYGPAVGRDKGHSAVFPQWLPDFFIKLFSDEGDIVLDPFAGSGTTFAAAKELGRVPVGIDIDPCEAAKEKTKQSMLDFWEAKNERDQVST